MDEGMIMKMKEKKQVFTKDSDGICPLVEAACCISNNGKGYDINTYFNSWVRDYINEKLKLKTASLSENNKSRGEK